jgi:DsbC/DsbD-like thiol-disulfide interchange protein
MPTRPSVRQIAGRIAASIVALLAVNGTLASAEDPMDDPAAVDRDRAGNAFLKTSLISDKSAVSPGESFVIGVQLEIKPGWHTYWPGMNDTGVAPIFHKTEASKNLTLGPVEYPAPSRYLNVGLLDHVYEGAATLLIPAKVSATAKAGERVTVEIDLEFLVCKETCIPGRSTLTIDLPVKDKGEPDAAGTSLIKAAQARLGTPIGLGTGAPGKGPTVAWASPTELKISATEASFIAYYPREDSLSPVELIETGENAKGGTLSLKFERAKGADKKPARVRGMIEVRRAAASEKAPSATDKGAAGSNAKPVATNTTSEFYTIDLAPPDAPTVKPSGAAGNGGGGPGVSP